MNCTFDRAFFDPDIFQVLRIVRAPDPDILMIISIGRVDRPWEMAIKGLWGGGAMPLDPGSSPILT